MYYASHKRWIKENKEHVNAYHRKYYREHREKLLIAKKGYKAKARVRFPEKVREVNNTYLRKYNRTFKGRFIGAKASAKKKGRCFKISFYDYTLLLKTPCYYCVRSLDGGAGIGLDRINNSKGYTRDNVLPCCGDCNMLRSNRYTVHETKVMVNALMNDRQARIR